MTFVAIGALRVKGYGCSEYPALMLTLLPVTFAISADNLANSLGTDQDRQNVHPDLDPNCLKELFVKDNFEKISRQQQKHEKLPKNHR